MGNVLINIGVVGAAAATADLSGIVNKMKQLRGEILEATKSSEAYYQVVNRSSQDMTQFNQVTQGMIDTMSSLRQSAVLSAAGIKVTDEQLAILGKRSIEFARKTGKDATATFEKMTQAITKGSNRVLLEFGIILDETEDKVLAQAEALQKLTENQDSSAMKAETVTEKMYAFNNTIGTLKDQLAAPALYNFLDWLGGTEKGFEGLSFALNSFSNDLTAGGQAFASWATSAEGALNLVSGVWYEITGQTEKATQAAREYYNELQKGRQIERERQAQVAEEEEEANFQRTMERMAAENNALAEAEWKRKKGGGGGRRSADGSAERDRSRDQSGQQGALDSYRQNELDRQMEYMRQLMEMEEEEERMAHERQLENMAEQNAMLEGLEGEHYAQLNGMQRRYYDDQKAWAQSDAAYKVQTATTAMGTLGGLFGQAAAMQDTESKKGFERNKNLQITQVAINTPSAAIGAFNAMAPIPIVGPALGAAAAAAATALGIAQMAKIKRTKFKGAPSLSNDTAKMPSRESVGNQYGAGNESAGTSVTTNVIIDGTVIHSSMIRANDGASQRGERSFTVGQM